MKPNRILVSWLLVGAAVSFGLISARSQPFDIKSFDGTAPGPWSDIAKTSLTVPKVANGSIKLDANPSSAEYGGFQDITVTPGVNAWILDYPDDRVSDGPADSSFTYWLAHDDTYFYVGVDVKDDIINSDDSNDAFWKDDSIEIIVDALNDRLDNNTDASNDPYGGHCYANYQGRFSRWDDAAGTINGQTWSSAIADWKYGPSDEVYGFGTNTVGGWKMEMRFKKTFFEDPAASNKLDDGYVMGFNIGLDDDDKTGPGPNGDGSRTQDLEIQYFWANRERHSGLTAEKWAELTPEQQKDEAYLNENFPLIINSNGRLSHGGAGQITFMAASAASGSPAELGTTVNGFQDDFTGATRDPDWKAFGPGGDRYEQKNGILYVSSAVGDPNHLLYMKSGYSNDVQEVLARIRVASFQASSHDYPRGGLGVGVQTNATDVSRGLNLHFRDSTQDNVPGRQFKLLDDARAWGPAGLRTNVPPQTTPGWTNNVWYWMRLKLAPKADGTNNLFGKVWVADNVTPEPADWQLTWKDSAIPKPLRTGFAGITGSSGDANGNGLAHLEVDYILIKAAGLPQIKVDFASTGPAPTPVTLQGLVPLGGNKYQVNWYGNAALEQAAVITGPWKAATSPAGAVTATGAPAFFRLQY